MDSLLTLPLTIVLSVLLTYLSSVCVERALLQDEYQQLVHERDELLAKKRNNPCIQDFEVLKHS